MRLDLANIDVAQDLRPGCGAVSLSLHGCCGVLDAIRTKADLACCMGDVTRLMPTGQKLSGITSTTHVCDVYVWDRVHHVPTPPLVPPPPCAFDDSFFEATFQVKAPSHSGTVVVR